VIGKGLPILLDTRVEVWDLTLWTEETTDAGLLDGMLLTVDLTLAMLGVLLGRRVVKVDCREDLVTEETGGELAEMLRIEEDRIEECTLDTGRLEGLLRTEDPREITEDEALALVTGAEETRGEAEDASTLDTGTLEGLLRTEDTREFPEDEALALVIGAEETRGEKEKIIAADDDGNFDDGAMLEMELFTTNEGMLDAAN
jgi:hypothetical protein